MTEDILCCHKDGALIAIHKPSGKWCSIEIDSDIVNTNITGVTVEQKEEIITLLSNITEQLTKLYA